MALPGTASAWVAYATPSYTRAHTPASLRPHRARPEPEPSLPESFEPLLVLSDARRLGEIMGIRFTVVLDGISRDAFAVRWRGQVHAYVNSCRHQSRNLDFGDAHFFDDACDALVCCHHGARYEPHTGVCVEGPCTGSSLTALAMEERGGALWCTGRKA
jgi:nitrite reductase/ring-hydroxylating ferredoxin subunit